MKNLENFLRPTQKQLFRRFCKLFKSRTLISKGNFILVQGQAPVLLVSHLDTVHDKPVRDFCLSSDKNILMSPQGIGGDDRCGVFALCYIFHIENLCSVNDSSRYCQNLTEHSIILHNLSDNLLDIYEVLLDFYSKAELDSFRSEYGDHILLLIFRHSSR